jgi:hypothetical protein
MVPETKEELTKRVALQLQIALTAWNELYPDDTDEDACRKSLDLVEFEVEDFLTRPDLPPPAALSEAVAIAIPREVPVEGDDEEAEVKAMTSRVGRRSTTRGTATIPFRQMLIEIAREYPGGFDISRIVEEAGARGWTHPNARNYVSIAASQLVKAGLLVRPERGTYALSPAFIGAAPGEDPPGS